MFSRPAKTSATHTDAVEGLGPARRSLPASLMAENVAIKGDVTSDGDVHLDGAINGDVRVGCLTVGEAGRINGAIEADMVVVRGRVTGSITARHVRLHGSAQVEGDITHTELAMDAGARFQGRSIRFEPAKGVAVEIPALPGAVEPSQGVPPRPIV